jgi:predicted nucleic acid-binding protein
MEEVTRVLRAKFTWSPESLSLFRERVGDFTERVTPSQKLDAVPDDPADNRILECAAEGKSEYLVTRDKHLLRLGRYGGTKNDQGSRFSRNCQAIEASAKK